MVLDDITGAVPVFIPGYSVNGGGEGFGKLPVEPPKSPQRALRRIAGAGTIEWAIVRPVL